MPACLAASMIGVPFGTATCMPSIVTVTNSCSGIRFLSSSLMLGPASRGRQRRLARAGDVGLELGAELLDAAHHRRGAGVAQHADRLAGHVFREVQQQLEVLLPALARQNPLEDPGGPRGAFAALGA